MAFTREYLARIAAETVAITQSGQYRSPAGVDVFIANAVRSAVERSQVILPSELAALRSRADALLAGRSLRTRFEVNNETTFSAARPLVVQFGGNQVAALNFASAKNPGGGFLSGSQAQEESLARTSALYACLLPQTAYYEANRKSRSCLYTDHLVVSPSVPVFRGSDDLLLEKPWEVTILTAPAPNAKAIAQNEPESLVHIQSAFRRRIEAILAAAVVSKQKALVLGAWGCGVFGNEPQMVANLFAEFLRDDGSFAKVFEHVTFAILDRGDKTIAPFARTFG